MEIKVAKGQSKAVVVSTWEQSLEAMDGREVTLDGIHGTIRIERPRPFDTRVMHYKSPKGRRSEAYQATRRRLRDDWDSDLTGDADACVAIAEALGVSFQPSA